MKKQLVTVGQQKFFLSPPLLWYVRNHIFKRSWFIVTESLYLALSSPVLIICFNIASPWALHRLLANYYHAACALVDNVVFVHEQTRLSLRWLHSLYIGYIGACFVIVNKRCPGRSSTLVVVFAGCWLTARASWKIPNADEISQFTIHLTIDTRTTLSFANCHLTS